VLAVPTEATDGTEATGATTVDTDAPVEPFEITTSPPGSLEVPHESSPDATISDAAKVSRLFCDSANAIQHFVFNPAHP